ncbi:MAG TPA: hypothetical protein VIL63_05215, partial [Terriglobales bacterium]
KRLKPVVRDGYSVQLSHVQRELAGVIYREGAGEIYWSAEWGTDDSLLVRISRAVSFAMGVRDDEVQAMASRDIVTLKLPRNIVEPENLTEDRIREIKKRVSEALDAMKIKHLFVREGWTSRGDANEITETMD